MRNVYHKRRDALIHSIERLKQKGFKLECETPDGGMAVWLNVGMDSQKIARRLASRGIFATPESAYQITPSRGTHLLLGFASQTEEELEKGIHLLASTLK